MSRPSHRRPSSQRAPIPWLLPLVLAAAVVGVYGQIVRHDFVNWDDDVHIVYNPHFHPVTLHSTLQFWREPYFGLYVPVSYTVFAAEAWLASQPQGEDGQPRFAASVFHAGSLLLHAACALLVFALLRRLVRNDWGAAAGALLFALHPLQVESVAWASETRGLLAAMFSLLCLLAWTQLVDEEPSAQGGAEPARRSRQRVAWYLLATLAFALAMLSKPSAAATPLLAAVLSVAWFRRGWLQTALWLLPWLAIVAAASLVTQRLQSQTPMLFVPPLEARPLIAADALQFYLVKLLAPLGLAAHYDRSPQAVIEQGWLSWCWIAPAALLAVVAWRPRPLFMTAAGLFVAALLPVLGLVPFAYQDYSTVADRYAYLALMGPSLLIAGWIASHSRWSPEGISVLLILALCGSLSFAQAARWRNSETLFTHNLAVNPRSEVARDNYASFLNQQGRYAEALRYSDETLAVNPRSAIAHGNRAAALEGMGRPKESLQSRRLAVQHDPSRVEARIALADALAKAGEPQQAEREYREALTREPGALRASFNLGLLLQQAGRDEEAMEQFRRVLARHPDDYRARMNLGLLSARAGRHEDAVEHFAWLAQTTGDLPARVQLAEAYVALGNMAAAFDEYRIVLREPSAAWAQVAGRVAWLLATHPEAEVRDGRQALQLALEACRQTNHQRPDLLRSLAAAYAETGDFARAEQTARRAQTLASDSGKQELAEQIATDVQHYAGGQPVRTPPRR